MLNGFWAARVAAVTSLVAIGAMGMALTTATGATIAPGSASAVEPVTVSAILAAPFAPDAVTTPLGAPNPAPAHIVMPKPAPIAAPAADDDDATTIQFPHSSLASLVSHYSDASVSGDEQRCLATAVYFESKSEPILGQLAVAQVVINRTHSGKFASSLCGVVKQRSQFSFVHGGALPHVPDNAQWRTAVGIAQIAMKKLYASPVPDALYFHAKRVSPGWNMHQLASVGHHIFYR